MKIILTESQINSIILEEKIAYLLQESFMQSKSLNSLKTKIKRAVIAGIAITSIMSAIEKLTMPEYEKDVLKDYVTEMTQDSNFEEKVKACKAYMEFALKNQNYNMNSTALKPETLVQKAYETGFDLPFLMAAAHEESCFGATPRAKRTGSVFSEGCFDDGRDRATFSDPNESVDSYIKLINTHYAIGGKSLLDLLIPGKFVNEDGHRYAKNMNYENDVKNIRNRIIKMYPILQQ